MREHIIQKRYSKGSESLSQNVRLGLQYRYQQGKVIVNHKRFLGYDKDDDGNLVVNKKEAEVVKRIFREYLEGYTFHEIAEGLTKDGIKTGAGNDHWFPSTLNKILRNEKYMGDALLQKTITTDFLTKKRVFNKGIAPQYYCREQPRGYYSQRAVYARPRRNGQKGEARNSERQAQNQIRQICIERHRLLRPLRRSVPKNALGHPRQEKNRVALCVKALQKQDRCGMFGKNNKRNRSSRCRNQSHKRSVCKAKRFFAAA